MYKGLQYLMMRAMLTCIMYTSSPLTLSPISTQVSKLENFLVTTWAASLAPPHLAGLDAEPVAHLAGQVGVAAAPEYLDVGHPPGEVRLLLPPLYPVRRVQWLGEGAGYHWSHL